MRRSSLSRDAASRAGGTLQPAVRPRLSPGAAHEAADQSRQRAALPPATEGAQNTGQMSEKPALRVSCQKEDGRLAD